MTSTVGPAVVGDIPVLLTLIEQYWAFEDIAGYLLAVYVFSLEHLGLTVEIDEFFVLPSCRGHGAGLRLLQLAEAEFARMKCANISLQLGRGNDAARAFYRERGYSERSGYELLDKKLNGNKP